MKLWVILETNLIIFSSAQMAVFYVRVANFTTIFPPRFLESYNIGPRHDLTVHSNKLVFQEPRFLQRMRNEEEIGSRAVANQGPILRSSISAEKFSDKFSPLNFGQIDIHN
jgi:hypothetical protein